MIRNAFLAASAAIAIAAPAVAQDFAITNATVAIGDGSEPIEGATVVVRGGKVASVSQGAAPAGITVVDGAGKWVTPGLFATVTQLGLSDVSAVSELNDASASKSPFSAALDVAPVINPASQHILVHRAAGITRAATVTNPASAIFGGQGAIIDLGADANAVVRPRAFQIVDLGEGGARLAGGSRASAQALFRNALREAAQLGNSSQRGDDALLTRSDAAALLPVVRGEQKLYVAVNGLRISAACWR